MVYRAGHASGLANQEPPSSDSRHVDDPAFMLLDGVGHLQRHRRGALGRSPAKKPASASPLRGLAQPLLELPVAEPGRHVSPPLASRAHEERRFDTPTPTALAIIHDFHHRSTLADQDAGWQPWNRPELASAPGADRSPLASRQNQVSTEPGQLQDDGKVHRRCPRVPGAHTTVDELTGDRGPEGCVSASYPPSLAALSSSR
jgi:hypothetical protein